MRHRTRHFYDTVKRWFGVAVKHHSGQQTFTLCPEDSYRLKDRIYQENLIKTENKMAPKDNKHNTQNTQAFG